MSPDEIKAAKSLAASIVSDNRWPEFREFLRLSISTDAIVPDEACQRYGMFVGVSRVISSIESCRVASGAQKLAEAKEGLLNESQERDADLSEE
jgi:hypothetical protein